MDSSAIARYIHQQSNKRVFTGSSSASMEPEVIEIFPPSNDSSSKAKAKALKQKEVVYHEIIDVDMDEDRNDVVFIEGMVESNKKRKGAMGISLGLNNEAQGSSQTTKKLKDAIMSSTPGSFAGKSDNFLDLDDYVFEDDYMALQSHFDNMDIPTGIEAPIPWLPDKAQMEKKASANPSVAPHISPLGASQSLMVDPQWSSLFSVSSKKKSTLGGPSTYSSLQSQSGSKNVQSVETPQKIQHKNMYFSGSSNPQVYSGGNSSSLFQLPMDNTSYPLGVDHTPISEWHQSIMKNHMELNGGTIFTESDMYPIMNQDPVNMPRSSSVIGSSSSMATPDNEDVLKRYESFKKFDTVMDHSDHYYASQNSSMKQPPKNWAKKIQDEWRILEKDLPDTIFVRAYESRMDLLRAVIIGAEGTPYHDGLFFFDVCFQSSYPNSPPLVHYHSGGLRINPNLYNCGKVCLSLLNTWTGGHQERWVPGTSTMLQVLVSIQGLILNTKPYFNEPGYAHSSGSVHGEKSSLQYNENTLILSLKTMVYTMKKPPKHFEDLVTGHFRNRVRDILMACKAYTEGVQVGCLVRGGVQDVDEGNNSCSPKFKNDVAACIKTLVTAFKKIGANEAQEFLALSGKKKTSRLSPVPAHVLAPAPIHTPAPIFPPFPFSAAIPAYNHYW